MFGHDFYHGFIQKYVVLFGTLFNDIKISRFDAAGNEEKVLKVPLMYGPRDHWLARVEADPDLDRPVAITLPRMSYEITDFAYAPNRKLATTQTWGSRYAGDNNVAYQATYMPVPYDFTFRLAIMAKTAEDAVKIVEQILPFFTPDWTITAHLLDDIPDYKMDIPVEIIATDYKDDYDHAFQKRRAIVWSIDFRMKGYIFGPQNKNKIIKIAKVNFYLGGTAADKTVDERITVRPGLTANGEPTTIEAE